MAIGDSSHYIHLKKENYRSYEIGKDKKGKDFSTSLQEQHNEIRENIIDKIQINNWKNQKEKIEKLLTVFSELKVSPEDYKNQQKDFVSKFFADKQSLEYFKEGINKIIQDNFNNAGNIIWERLSGTYRPITNSKNNFIGQKITLTKTGRKAKDTIQSMIQTIINAVQEKKKIGSEVGQTLNKLEVVARAFQRKIDDNKEKFYYNLQDVVKPGFTTAGDPFFSLEEFINLYNKYVISDVENKNIANIQGLTAEVAITALGLLNPTATSQLALKNSQEVFSRLEKLGMMTTSSKTGKKITAGSSTISRQYNDIWAKGSFEKGINKINIEEGKKIKIQNASVEYANTQGKIDVDFSVPEIDESHPLFGLKISVKNYSSTSLLSIVSGTPLLYIFNFLNENYASHWLNLHTSFSSQLSEELDETILNNSHKMMIYCVGVIALTGYIGNREKESSLMANVFAVNKSSSTKMVQFVSMADIINNITGGKNTLDFLKEIKKYFDFKINDKEGDSFVIRQQREETVEERISNIIMDLHKAKVHVSIKSAAWNNI